jgi:hypothetical protein
MKEVRTRIETMLGIEAGTPTGPARPEQGER